MTRTIAAFRCAFCERTSVGVNREGAHVCSDHRNQPPERPAGRKISVTRSRDKLNRLRERIAQARAANPDDPVPGILGAIVDLLEEMTQ